jgi:hypothetical protein
VTHLDCSGNADQVYSYTKLIVICIVSKFAPVLLYSLLISLSGRRMPDSLKGITVSNVTTFPTRVRVRLLKEVCRRHQAANPSLSCLVTNFLHRPELKVRDRKGPMLSLTYTETVQKFSHYLTPEFLTELTTFARTNLPEEEVRDRFLVLSPDYLSGPPTSAEAMSVSGTPPPAPAPAPVPTPPPLPQIQASTQASASASGVPGTLPSTPLLLDWSSFEADPVGPANVTLGQISPSAGLVNSQTSSHQLSSNSGGNLPKRNRDRFAPKTVPYNIPA